MPFDEVAVFLRSLGHGDDIVNMMRDAVHRQWHDPRELRNEMFVRGNELTISLKGVQQSRFYMRLLL